MKGVKGKSKVKGIGKSNGVKGKGARKAKGRKGKGKGQRCVCGSNSHWSKECP